MIAPILNQNGKFCWRQHSENFLSTPFETSAISSTVTKETSQGISSFLRSQVCPLLSYLPRSCLPEFVQVCTVFRDQQRQNKAEKDRWRRIDCHLWLQKDQRPCSTCIHTYGRTALPLERVPVLGRKGLWPIMFKLEHPVLRVKCKHETRNARAASLSRPISCDLHTYVAWAADMNSQIINLSVLFNRFLTDKLSVTAR